MIYLKSVVTAAALGLGATAAAQCPNTIQTFPYYEDFEASAGGWTPGGTGSDWSWGAPVKGEIDAAASGANAWIVGGLAESFYSLGQRSYVESPCFDFTGLVRPYVRLKIWWETERLFDGANLQYSLDGGLSWTNVGTYADTADCRNVNWYNTLNINNLEGLSNPRPGWSGNVQGPNGNCVGGGGSGGWLEARHTLLALAGQPSVRLRVTFGAGTTCNAYDGFAFDDVRIEEAPEIVAVTAIETTPVSCAGAADGTASIAVAGGQTPVTYAWPNAAVTGPAAANLPAGEYVVTVTDAAGCSVPAVFAIDQPPAMQIAATVQDVSCDSGNDGAASLTVTGGSEPYAFEWPAAVVATGATASMLAPGTYVATVTDGAGCTATSAIVVGQEAAVVVAAPHVENPGCFTENDGFIVLAGTGGTPPYVFTWSGGTVPGDTLAGLAAGEYVFTVTDAAGCTDTELYILTQPPALDFQTAITAACAGEPVGSVRVLVTAGTPPYQFILGASGWQTDPLFTGLAAGTYVLRIDDSGGCVVEDTLVLPEAPLNAATASGDTTVYAGQPVPLLGAAAEPGRVAAYAWTPAEFVSCPDCPATVAVPVRTTVFTFTATDSSGCTSAAEVRVEVERPPVYVPNVFAPGSTGLNADFTVAAGPGVQEVELLQVFDRWGSLVHEKRHFAADGLASGWDGRVRGREAPAGVYAYLVRVLYADGTAQWFEGNVTVVR